MASKGISILLFVLSILCRALAFSNENFVRMQAERLVNKFNLSQKAVNIVRNNVLGSAGFVERTFMFPGIRPSNTYSIENLGHHAGYFPIKHSYDARMFYFFFESRGKKSDPVVLWLVGGPGVACELSLFFINGPFRINDDLSLKWNDYGWDKTSNILFIDQPTGTGFSYSSDERDIRTNQTGISNDMYDFLQAFFAARPEFAKNDFYIAGQSYAGHYIPVLASRVHKGNKAKEGIHINLKGLAIGNGFTDPAYQYAANADFALANKLISRLDYKHFKKSNLRCLQAIKECQTDDDKCKNASVTCERILNNMVKIMDNINIYDIRKVSSYIPYDMPRIKNFLGLASVKKALGIGDIKFVSSSQVVFNALEGDIMKNYAPEIPPLLEDGIKVLIYAGDFDLICNWFGIFRWVHAMKWSGQRQFSKAKLTSYKVGGQEAGQVKSTGPLTFLKVHDAGHSVPIDHPNISLEMLKSWMNA